MWLDYLDPSLAQWICLPKVTPTKGNFVPGLSRDWLLGCLEASRFVFHIPTVLGLRRSRIPQAKTHSGLAQEITAPHSPEPPSPSFTNLLCASLFHSQSNSCFSFGRPPNGE
ncbi:hypothetical protein CRENBAI_022676 [Crenichthys baileyi]|uniref:Uncharacterized protein n=1 Tax=Crenichthys baileyi TaxID=28760 RepID=A0AAV9QWA7_9TELE